MADQESATWASPAFAVKFAGGARFTNSVVDPVCEIVEVDPVTVSESA